MIVPQKTFFSKHKNEAEFKCLDDSEVLSSDFPGLKTSAASMTSVTSTASVASTTSTASFHQKNYWCWWLDHPLHPNDQNQPLFVEGIIKNPNNYWYLAELYARILTCDCYPLSTLDIPQKLSNLAQIYLRFTLFLSANSPKMWIPRGMWLPRFQLL